MRISCVQMDMRLGAPEENFAHAAACIAPVTGPAPAIEEN